MAVLFLPLILGRLIATIKTGLSILCFKGSQVDFPNKCVLQSLNIAFIKANNADPDEMQQSRRTGRAADKSRS